MASDLFSSIHLFLRWLHVLAGIAWVGLLYFFNFVNVPMQSALDDATKNTVNPQLLPRALWWFRWSAMVTFLIGWVLFTLNYMFMSGAGWGPSLYFRNTVGLTGRAIWILIGMLFGTIMWFNVWFVIWPAQKKILRGQTTPERLPLLRARAARVSKINAILSGPMLVGMLAAPHYGAINLVTFLVFSAVAGGLIHVAFALSKRVGTSI